MSDEEDYRTARSETHGPRHQRRVALVTPPGGRPWVVYETPDAGMGVVWLSIWEDVGECGPEAKRAFLRERNPPTIDKTAAEAMSDDHRARLEARLAEVEARADRLTADRDKAIEAMHDAVRRAENRDERLAEARAGVDALAANRDEIQGMLIVERNEHSATRARAKRSEDDLTRRVAAVREAADQRVEDARTDRDDRIASMREARDRVIARENQGNEEHSKAAKVWKVAFDEEKRAWETNRAELEAERDRLHDRLREGKAQLEQLTRAAYGLRSDQWLTHATYQEALERVQELAKAWTHDAEAERRERVVAEALVGFESLAAKLAKLTP